jgi:hypothetical protein
MRRTASVSRKLPAAWHAAEFAALRVNAMDTCDDRVSEDIFDVDDERAEVAVMVHALNNTLA